MILLRWQGNNDYYPFGLDMPGRSGGDYRYGFNGKEKDNDGEIGSLTHYDYGFRIYNPGIGRFLSVDPLMKDYPMLTPYQFASNTPIMAIDLDGLEAFFIHGTNSSPSRWNEASIAILKKITNNDVVNTGFSWAGSGKWYSTKPGTAYLGNNERDRHIAAERLANYVLENRVAGEEITLIGHSHGGNVVIQAAKIIWEKTGGEDGGIKCNVITIATPAYNSKDDPENPSNNPGINDHIHLYNDKDTVQAFWSNAPDDAKFSDKTYSNQETTNVNIDVSKEYPKKGTEAHSFDVEHPETIENANVRKLKPVKWD